MIDKGNMAFSPTVQSPPSGGRPDGRKRPRSGTAALVAARPWLVPASLILLSLVPVGAGGVRILELASSPEVTPDNARFVAAPLPVVLHIVCASVFSVLGAFQFVPSFRRRRPGWHRAAGRVLIPSGIVAAASGLWMTVFYPLPAHDGGLLGAFRLLFGTAMLASLLLGLAAVRRRDFSRHGDWMLRGYAIGMGAGTQALILAPWFLVLGPLGVLQRALLMGAGWVINLGIAEWIIRGRWNARPAPIRSMVRPRQTVPPVA